MSWPAYTMPGVLPLVFVALSVGLIIAPLRAFSREYSAVSRPWSGVSLAGIVIVGATALVVFAGSDDGYFFPQPKTYWEFGGTGGRTLVPLALAAAVVAVVALGASHFARSPSRSLRVTSSLLACVAFGALIVGFVAIGTGH